MKRLHRNQRNLRRLWRLLRPLLISEAGWRGWGLLALLALFALSIAGINVVLSFLARDFMTAFSLRDRDEFYQRLVYYLIGFAVATPVTVFYRYTEERLALHWRRVLSHELLGKYFSGIAYYRVASYEGIDNPDQRIEEDVRAFTSTTLSLFLIIVNSVLTLVLFVGILWSISTQLIVAVVLYALIGSSITYLVGRPLIELNFLQFKKDGDYRYKLVNVRDNVESIAFFRAARKELTRTRQKLKISLANFRRIINLNRNLGFFITAYNNVKPVVPVVVVSPLYMSGQIELGVVTQAVDAFIRIVEALSVLIQNFGMISTVSALVRRLGSFADAIDQVSTDEPYGKKIPRVTLEEGDRLIFREVDIMTPRGERTLLKKVSFEAEKSLLISGPSGYGKSSLLRVAAGLWSAGNGRILRPPLKRCFFLPQRPYMPLGTFRSQFLYTLDRRVVADPDIVEVIKLVDLHDTLDRVGGLDVTLDWQSFLSTGEQQRLAFARLLLSEADFAFLDEATTAIDAEIEERLYTLLRERTKMYVSVGHRGPLSRYHDQILELKIGGGWKLERKEYP